MRVLPVPGQKFVDPLSWVILQSPRTSASQACGSMSLSLVSISVWTAAARRPPSSEPVKVRFLRPVAMPRSPLGGIVLVFRADSSVSNHNHHTKMKSSVSKLARFTFASTSVSL